MSDPLTSFAATAAALATEDWDGFVALCDPVSVRSMHRLINDLHFKTRPARELTAADLRKIDPAMPRDVAEYQVSRWRAQVSERAAAAEGELAGVITVEQYLALEPAAAMARWLEAHSERRLLEAALKRLPAPPKDLPVEEMLPRERLVPLGAVSASPDLTVVVFRRTHTGGQDQRPEAADITSHLPVDERELAEACADHDLDLAMLRRQPGGEWQLLLTYEFLQQRLHGFGAVSVMEVGDDDVQVR